MRKICLPLSQAGDYSTADMNIHCLDTTINPWMTQHELPFSPRVDELWIGAETLDTSLRG